MKELDLSIDHKRGLKHWNAVLERAKKKDKELLKLFVGLSRPFTFEEIQTKAEEKIELLERIKAAKKA